MKTIISALLTLILIVAGISLWRAASVYQDVQYRPSAGLSPVVVDEAALVQRLSAAIQIPTVSKDDPDEVDPQPFLDFHQFLRNNFPRVHESAELNRINDYSLVFKFPGVNPDLKPVLLMGHMDVVSVDEITAQQWRYAPYSGQVADGMIWGRGAIDDKSTVMALMEAMELTLVQGQAFERTIYFAFGHDEEVGGKQGAAHIARYFQEQGVSFEFVLDEGGVILEQGMMPGFEHKVAIIGIAEKGFVNIRLVVEQAGGHSSQPPENTGPGILAQAIVNLEANKFPTDIRFTNMTFDKIGHYADFKSRLAMANQWLLGSVIENTMLAKPKTAASIRTTTAVTMLSGSSKSNILPTKSTAVVNFRIMPGQTAEGVADYVKQVIDDPRVKLEVFMANNPSPVSKTDSYGYRLLEQTIRELDDEILVAPYMVQGGTDSKYFYPLSDAIYRFIMVKIDDQLLTAIHGIDERIAIDDYVRGVQYFHEIIRKASSGE